MNYPPKPDDSKTQLSPHLYTLYKQELRLRGYARATIKTYSACLRSFVPWLKPGLPRDAKDEQIRAYLLQILEVGSSRALVDQTNSALKFLYVELCQRPADSFRVHRPKRASAPPWAYKAGGAPPGRCHHEPQAPCGRAADLRCGAAGLGAHRGKGERCGPERDDAFRTGSSRRAARSESARTVGVSAKRRTPKQSKTASSSTANLRACST